MRLKISALLLLTLIMSGCGPTHKITGSWAAPDAKSFGPYKKAFIIVLTQNKNNNYYIEQQMAKTLKSRGIDAVKSNDIFPPKFSVTQDMTKEQLAEAIKKTGCDAVLTLSVLDVKSVESYHPGTSYYPVSYGYGGYYGYYNYYYPQVYSPGYYSVDKTYYLETNLYDMASDKLVWSVQSESSNPTNLSDAFKSYSYMLIKHLQSEGLAKNK
jgi:hypothetical protein